MHRDGFWVTIAVVLIEWLIETRLLSPEVTPELRKQPPLHSIIAAARHACLLLVSLLPAAWPHCLKSSFRAALMDFLLPSLLGVPSPYRAWSGILGPSILHPCPAQWGTGRNGICVLPLLTLDCSETIPEENVAVLLQCVMTDSGKLMFFSKGEIPSEPGNRGQRYGKQTDPSGIFVFLPSVDFLDNSSSAMFPEFYFFLEGQIWKTSVKKYTSW